MLIFTTITNLFAVNNLSTEVQNMVKGGIIVAAVLVQQFRVQRVAQFAAKPLTAPEPYDHTTPGDRPLGRPPGLSTPTTHFDQEVVMTDVRRPVPPPAARSAAPRSAPARCSPRCTSNDSDDDNTDDQTQRRPTATTPTPGKTVTIGFSAPAADHGWIAAITNNAKAQAADVLAT